MNLHESPWLELEEIPCVPLRNVFLHVTKACNLNCTYCSGLGNEGEIGTTNSHRVFGQRVRLRLRR